MSDAHSKRDLKPVARVEANHRATGIGAWPPPPRRASRSLIWVVGFGGAAVIVAAGLLYGHLTDTPAAARRSAATAEQGRAQFLGRRATASQRAADQSATQSRALAVVAAKDNVAANRAAVSAADAGKAAAADR